MDGCSTQKHQVGCVEVPWTRGGGPEGWGQTTGSNHSTLPGRRSGHERNPQDGANVYSSGSVEVEGREAMLV